MGEVYRARDTRLDRVVAVKILPAALAGDPEFRERFEREARSISALEHPHICPLYDVGEQAGTAFLVMPYLEGETLAERLERGAVPLADALAIAIQMASALDRAHRQGIVHRDLKPGNIFLVRRIVPPGDSAKLLDFGLASSTGPVVAAAGLTMAPRLEQAADGCGTVLGTFQYMSPEQIEGEDADARTDIFALGVVLYEMLTGRRAFEGKSYASLAGAILKDQPAPISAVTQHRRPALDFAVERCLAKDPAERWHTARDLMGALKWIARGGDAVPTTDLVSGARGVPKNGTRLVDGRGGHLCHGRRDMNVRRPASPPPAPIVRFSVAPDPAALLRRNVGGGLALSPDGTVLVYVGVPEGQAAVQLYRRDMSGSPPHPIKGTEGGFAPFFSPDGEWLAFFTDEHLLKMPATGGPPAIVCAKGPRIHAAPGDQRWGQSFSGGVPHPARVRSAGCLHRWKPTPLTTLKEGERLHQYPQILPDGRHLVFALRDNVGAKVAITDIASGDHRVLFEGQDVRFVAPGTLIYAGDTEVFSVPFDTRTLTVTGAPTPVALDVTTVPIGSLTFMLLAADSRGGVAFATKSSREAELTWMDTRGTLAPLPLPRAEYGNARLAPDGRRLGGHDGDASLRRTFVWVLDLLKGTRLLFWPRAHPNLSPGRGRKRRVRTQRRRSDHCGRRQRSGATSTTGGDIRYSVQDSIPGSGGLLITIARTSRGAIDRQIGHLLPGGQPDVDRQSGR